MGACISRTEQVVIDEFKNVILPVIVEELTKEVKKIQDDIRVVNVEEVTCKI